MPKLTPRLASRIAYLPYQLYTSSEKEHLRVHKEIRGHFTFSKASASFKGESGGIFGFGRKSEGFALVGIGQGRHANELVIAIRGTKSTHNWMTNGNLGLKGAPNNFVAHAGFINTFQSLKPQIKAFYFVSGYTAQAHTLCRP